MRPFSTHNVDELLADLNLTAKTPARFLEWLAPINPKHYRHALPRLKKRVRRSGARHAAMAEDLAPVG